MLIAEYGDQHIAAIQDPVDMTAKRTPMLEIINPPRLIQG